MSARRERDLAAIEAARDLELRLTDAVRVDYPDLCAWAMRRSAIRRTGPGPDDWVWDGSVSGRARRARRYLAEAATLAARRISEAYGLGAGGAWAAKHGLGEAVSDPDRWAAAQVRASLRAVQRVAIRGEVVA